MVRRTVWTMGNGLQLRRVHSFSSLDHNLVHTGQDAEHLGLGDARREHNARCIVPSKTTAHATAKMDDERGAVLLFHNGHDAEHRRPDDNRREHSAKRNTRKTSKASVPLPQTTTSVAGRGRRFRRLLLPPLLPLPPPQGGPRVGRLSGELLEPALLCRCPESTRRSEQRLHLVRPLLRLLTLLQLLLPLLLLPLPQGSSSEVPE